MAALSKKQKDETKQKQSWKCGNPKCQHGKGGTRATIKTGGQIHHKNRDPDDNRKANLIALCTKCHQKVKRHPREPLVAAMLKWAGQ